MVPDLRDAVLLGLMDREEAVEDARVVEARILGFDEIDESPDGSFAVHWLARAAWPSKALAKTDR